MGLCTIMLKHEMMVADEWHDNGPQDLFTASLCIKIANDKMQLFSFKKPGVEVLGWRGDMKAAVVWLEVLSNSLKQCWRWLMVEKLTFNSLATALVNIPGANMPIADSLKS